MKRIAVVALLVLSALSATPTALARKPAVAPPLSDSERDALGDLLLASTVPRLGGELMPASAALTSFAHALALPVRVVVVSSPHAASLAFTPEAVVVTSGLLGVVEDGQELAAILRHEAAHAKLRHLVGRLEASYGSALLRDGLGRPEHPILGGVSANLASFGLFARGGVEDETRADNAALQACAGHARDLLDVQARFPRRRGRQAAQALVHPLSRAREHRLLAVTSAGPCDGAELAVQTLVEARVALTAEAVLVPGAR